MLQVFLLALALSGAAPGQRGLLTGPDPIQGPMAVSGKDVLGMPAPQCTNRREEQRAMEARMRGLTPECIVRPRKRNGNGLDQNQPRP